MLKQGIRVGPSRTPENPFDNPRLEYQYRRVFPSSSNANRWYSMAKFRLSVSAVLWALLAMSCGGSPSQPSLASTPTAPSPISSLSDSTANDGPRSRTPVDLDDVNALIARTFTISGVVTDKAYAAWKLSGATVTITPGARTTRTSSTGQFSIRLPAGAYTFKITQTGYASATIKKSVGANAAVNAALTPTKPAGATARCKDRTWSKSQNRSGTCSSHKGVAYWVCPGKLC